MRVTYRYAGVDGIATGVDHAHLRQMQRDGVKVLSVVDERASNSECRTTTADANDYRPPDPYTRDLAALCAAETTTPSAFEATWKAQRQRELDAERARHAAARAATPRPRLTAAEAAAENNKYHAPDSYALALQRAKEERRR
jgi:hypothetical protein